MTKNEKIDVLSTAYHKATQMLAELRSILQDAHDETNTRMRRTIDQELNEEYPNCLADELQELATINFWEADLLEDPICPRCHKEYERGREAISRFEPHEDICSECGTEEALLQFTQDVEKKEV